MGRHEATGGNCVRDTSPLADLPEFVSGLFSEDKAELLLAAH